MAKVVYLALRSARHQREADLFVQLQALANEKVLTCLDTSQVCVSARVVLTLPSCLCYNTHTTVLSSNPAFSLRLPPGLRRDTYLFGHFSKSLLSL